MKYILGLIPMAIFILLYYVAQFTEYKIVGIIGLVVYTIIVGIFIRIYYYRNRD